MYDLVIVGLGPAGLTAAIYAARYTLRTLVIGSSSGGQVAESGRIENYPGFKQITGSELAQKMIEQAKSFGVEIVRGEVLSIKNQGGRFRVSVGERVYKSRAVILAIGVEPRKLDVPGEVELIGKGVSYCALCDAPLFKDKVVAMVGGGDSALDGALELAEHAQKIYLIHRREDFRAKPDFVKRVRENPKIELVLNTKVTQIKGGTRVESVALDTSHHGQSELSVEGVFIEIGNLPPRKLSEDLGLKSDEVGYIEVSDDMSTSLTGVFAAGDITTGSNGMKQIVTACAEGALAAQSVYNYLRSQKLEVGGQELEVGGGKLEKGGGDMTEGKKLVVAKETCIGCGLCVTVAPNTFKLGDDGKAEVVNPTGDPQEKIQEAVSSCPVNAINFKSEG